MRTAAIAAKPERHMVVTGASGLLGVNFVLSARRSWRITGLYGKHVVNIPEIACVQSELRSGAQLQPSLDRFQPRLIVHLAAATDVDWCEEHPSEARAINVEGTHALANWAAAHNCPFVFISTDSVFDGVRGNYSESDEPRPLNRYAATKLEAESVVRNAGANHLIIRANIYGWNSQNKRSLAEWVLARLESKETVSGFTDVVFSPLLVNTLSEILLAMIERGARGTFHLASTDAISKYDFALMIAEIFGFPKAGVVPATLASARLRAPRPLNTSLNTERFRRDLDIYLPSIREDLLSLKSLQVEGYASRLKTFCSSAQ